MYLITIHFDFNSWQCTLHAAGWSSDCLTFSMSVCWSVHLHLSSLVQNSKTNANAEDLIANAEGLTANAEDM